jgi:hypothetical protein
VFQIGFPTSTEFFSFFFTSQMFFPHFNMILGLFEIGKIADVWGPAWQCLGHRASCPDWQPGRCPPVTMWSGIKPPYPNSTGSNPPFSSPGKPQPYCHLFPRCWLSCLTSVLLPHRSSPAQEPNRSHRLPSLGSRAPPSEGSSEDHRAAIGEGATVHLLGATFTTTSPLSLFSFVARRSQELKPSSPHQRRARTESRSKPTVSASTPSRIDEATMLFPPPCCRFNIHVSESCHRLPASSLSLHLLQCCSRRAITARARRARAVRARGLPFRYGPRGNGSCTVVRAGRNTTMRDG